MIDMLAHSKRVALFGALLLMKVTAAQFVRTEVLKSGDKPNVCGAIIAQCLARCSDRAKEGSEGREYVQMTIAFVNNDTKCVTKETDGDEIVSTNPPNDNHAVVLFNVPCCQQRPFKITSTRNRTPSPVASPVSETKRSTAAILITKPLDFRDNFASRKLSTTRAPQTMSVKDLLQILFTALCVILTMSILAIMLWKLSKKRWNKKNLQNGTESPQVTNAVSNGTVLVGGNNEKPLRFETRAEEKRNAQELLDINCDSNRPCTGRSHDDFRKEPSSSDYIQLETAQTNPKSMKSSRSRLDEKAQEVLMIGTGSCEFSATGNHYRIRCDSVRAATQQEGTRESDLERQTNADIGRSSFKRVNLENDRLASLWERTDIVNESEYHKMGSTDNDGIKIGESKHEAATEVTKCRAGDDAMNAEFRDQNGIYNVLRGKEMSDLTGDYQRLKRIEPNKSPTYDDVINRQPVSPEGCKPLGLRSVEGGYVQDFQVLHSNKRTQLNRRSLDGDTVPTNDYLKSPLSSANNVDNFWRKGRESTETTENEESDDL